MREYVGQIRPWLDSKMPANYLPCEGQALEITQYQALYSVIGNSFGGGGVKFNLPDLRGRFPLGLGTTETSSKTYRLGESGGGEKVVLTEAQIPAHDHYLKIDSSIHCAVDPKEIFSDPEGNSYSKPSVSVEKPYGNTYQENKFTGEIRIDFDEKSVGKSVPHENMPPFMAVRFIICVYGDVPVCGDESINNIE